MANKNVIAIKEAKVNELAEHIKGAKLILLVDYRGTTVADDTKLRKDIREANGDIKVMKNNIIKRALDANKESGLDDVLEGPTAIVSATEDYLQPLNILHQLFLLNKLIGLSFLSSFFFIFAFHLFSNIGIHYFFSSFIFQLLFTCLTKSIINLCL